MIYLQRIPAPLISALFITSALLYTMFQLVQMDEPELSFKKSIRLPPFTRVDEDEDPRTITVKPTKPIEAEEKPPIPVEVTRFDGKDIENPEWIEYTGGRQKGDLQLFNNSQLVLALGYPPVYPSGPLRRGIEGYAVVGFSVGTSGAVFDPFIIESEPKGTFDRASLKAILKFKYKPKHVDGKPVITDGQRYMFTYKIDA